MLLLCAVQKELKAKLSDSRYSIAMENHEFGVAPEAFTKWIVLNDTYDILSTSKDRSVEHALLCWNAGMVPAVPVYRQSKQQPDIQNCIVVPSGTTIVMCATRLHSIVALMTLGESCSCTNLV